MSLGFSGSLPGIFYTDFLYLYLLLANKRDDDDHGVYALSELRLQNSGVQVSSCPPDTNLKYGKNWSLFQLKICINLRRQNPVKNISVSTKQSCSRAAQYSYQFVSNVVRSIELCTIKLVSLIKYLLFPKLSNILFAPCTSTVVLVLT
jgi:hypothetical protein